MIMIIHIIDELFLLIFGSIVLISGIRKEERTFVWAGINEKLIKKPVFNIICGTILISTAIVGFLHIVSIR